LIPDICPADTSTALKALGKDKAPGPSSFTIRHIKKAYINKILADLFRSVLNKSQACLKWFNLLMIFIPKCDPGYNGSITKLRPITLLETIQKLFLKVLFSRITDKIVEHSILIRANTLDLTSTSTSNSLIDLSVLLKEVKRTGSPGHLILEDKSAAFDSFKYEHINLSLSHIESCPKSSRLTRISFLIVNLESLQPFAPQKSSDHLREYSKMGLILL
jgi:hypothetical protein